MLVILDIFLMMSKSAQVHNFNNIQADLAEEFMVAYVIQRRNWLSLILTN